MYNIVQYSQGRSTNFICYIVTRLFTFFQDAAAVYTMLCCHNNLHVLTPYQLHPTRRWHRAEFLLGESYSTTLDQFH